MTAGMIVKLDWGTSDSRDSMIMVSRGSPDSWGGEEK